MILGIDVSTYFEEERAHAKYFDSGKEIQPLDEFIKQGVNHMRIRLWNNPYNKEGKQYRTYAKSILLGELLEY